MANVVLQIDDLDELPAKLQSVNKTGEDVKKISLTVEKETKLLFICGMYVYGFHLFNN